MFICFPLSHLFQTLAVGSPVSVTLARPGRFTQMQSDRVCGFGDWIISLHTSLQSIHVGARIRISLRLHNIAFYNAACTCAFAV